MAISSPHWQANLHRAVFFMLASQPHKRVGSFWGGRKRAREQCSYDRKKYSDLGRLGGRANYIWSKPDAYVPLGPPKKKGGLVSLLLGRLVAGLVFKCLARGQRQPTTNTRVRHHPGGVFGFTSPTPLGFSLCFFKRSVLHW